MNYQHPGFYPGGRLWKFEAHLNAMSFVCRHLLDAGAEVVLFTTDGSDEIGLRGLLSRLSGLDGERTSRIKVAECSTVESLWETFGRVDFVVASRLHGALLAHVAGRPAFALGHEQKVRTMMTDVGHSDYCFDMLRFDESRASVRLDQMIVQRAQLADEVLRRVKILRREVEAQYDSLFRASGGFAWTDAPGQAYPRGARRWRSS
jgi:polysaccharide pyruvyl transferase WcaK-like protein